MAIVLDGEEAKMRAELARIDDELKTLAVEAMLLSDKQNQLWNRSNVLRQQLEKSVRLAIYGSSHNPRSY